MIYLSAWFSLYFFGLMKSLLRYKGELFSIVILFLFSTIIIFRGDVGTDTFTYQNMAKDLTGLFEQVEIGYSAFVLLVKNISSDEVFVIRMVAVLFSFVFIFTYITGLKDERFVIYFYILPAFFFSYGMNVIRIGVASILFVLAVRMYFNGGFKRFLFIALVSLSFHYSIVFCYFFLFCFFNRLVSFKTFFGLFLILILILLVYEYLLLKLDLYSGFYSPSIFSGFSTLIVISVIVVSVIVSNLPKYLILKIIYIVFAFSFFSYFLSMASYLGLRLLDLIKFSLPLVVFYSHFSVGRTMSFKTKFLILFAGLCSVFFTFRNFLDPASGFLPYTTFLN